MKYLKLFVILLAVASCKQYRGGVPIRQNQFHQMEDAVMKADVQKIFGSPAATNYVGNEKWFYYTSVGDVFAFLDPKFSKYEILVVEFDKNDTIVNVALRNLANKSIEFSKEETYLPSKIELNFLQELFGNIGRFSAGSI